MKCKVCPNDHDIRRCELVNGSKLDLCGPCRRRHDALISMVPMTDEEADAGRDPYETPEEGEAVPEPVSTEKVKAVRVAHVATGVGLHELSDCPNGAGGPACPLCIIPF